MNIVILLHASRDKCLCLFDPFWLLALIQVKDEDASSSKISRALFENLIRPHVQEVQRLVELTLHDGILLACCHMLPCIAMLCYCVFCTFYSWIGYWTILKVCKLWMLGAFAYSSMRQCREDRNPRCATGGWLCTCSQAPRNASRVVRQGELLLSFCFGRWRFQINYTELCPGQSLAAMLQWVNHQHIRIFLSRWGQFNCSFQSWFLLISVPATSWYPNSTCRSKYHLDPSTVQTHVVSPKASPGALWDTECRTYCRTRCSLPGQDVLFMHEGPWAHALLNYLTAAQLLVWRTP